ncbi:MAG TPA: efflux transporter outer membrane subunit [Caulobacteraceae bacterium]|jgi:NodT family efflux transporter outer membrane factor (OMF) lipoprotein
MADRSLRAHVASTGALLAGLLLSACSFAPAYAPPQLAAPLPAAYKETGPWTPAAPADTAPRGAWWVLFGDPTLNDLEGRIDKANPDLAAALARYDQARALLSQARASFLPEADYDGHFTRNRQSDQKQLPGSPTYVSDNVVGGQITYELDLWGRVRNTVKAERASSQASAEDLAATRLSLQAQLASAYLSLRAMDADAAVLADAIAAYEKALTLTEARYRDGAATEIDVDRARSQLETAHSQQASTLSSRALFEHAIASLIGQPASTFSLAANPGAFPAPPSTPVSAASELLQRRPDVAAAERRAFAANARIGVAKAAFFPTIGLDAGGGFDTSHGNLLSAGASYWTLGPSIFLPIFDAGRRQSVARQAQAEFDEASANYKSVVLSAFQQVEDSLAQCNRLATASDAEAKAADAAARAQDIALKQYRDGATTYLDVVTAQTAALDAKRLLVGLNSQRLQASVSLVRALGGGWQAGSSGA